jgi:hypothetical protein
MHVLPSELESRIVSELQYFDSDVQRRAFSSVRVQPQSVTQRWQYGEELHTCVVVAKNEKEQIVYCATGFGPLFPWSVQPLGAQDLGSDGEWHAYLYESFVSSSMSPHPAPRGFMHMGPGERAKT